MSTLAQKVAFVRKHWRTATGGPYEVDPDDPNDWQYHHFWRPLDSFRLIAVDKEKLCDDCRLAAWSLTEDYFSADKTRTKQHAKKHDCAGLQPVVIRFVLLGLRRQGGKTTCAAGYIGATLYLDDNESIEFISGSEDQSGMLFGDHYKAPIKASPALLSRAKIRGNSIEVRAKGRHTKFIFSPTSLSGTTGGTRTKLVVDEARSVPGKVVMGLIPQIFAQNGWRCPTRAPGHTSTKGDLDDPKRTTCAACGSRLIPWSGQVLIMTSAGELDGGDCDWFFELTDENERDPHPSAYVYVDPEAQARHVAESTVEATAEFFGKAESLQTYVDIETRNEPRRKGEDFITDQEQKRAEDKSLVNRERGDGPCVAYLDTSVTTELTSLVFLGDDSKEGEEDWHRVAMWRVDIWDPKQLRGGIDEQEIEDHLDLYIPLFSPLWFRIDTRRMPWAMKLVQKCKKKPWRRIVDGCDDWRRTERRLAWQKLEQYIIGERIRIFHRATKVGKILCKELKAARRMEDLEGNIDIREKSRKRRHLDVAESLASCCYGIHTLQAKPARHRRSMADVQKKTVRGLLGGKSTLRNRSRLSSSLVDND